MNLIVNKESKYAIVWMTNAEKAENEEITVLSKRTAVAR